MRDGRVVADSAIRGMAALRGDRSDRPGSRLPGWPRVTCVRVGAADCAPGPTRALLSALGHRHRHRRDGRGGRHLVLVARQLDRQLAALGTNLLTVAPGQTLSARTPTLPAEAEAMIARIGPVTAVSATGAVGDAKVYRSDRIPRWRPTALSASAARVSLPPTVGATVRSGTWLNGVTGRYPAAVLGADAAERLGIGRRRPGRRDPGRRRAVHRRRRARPGRRSPPNSTPPC